MWIFSRAKREKKMENEDTVKAENTQKRGVDEIRGIDEAMELYPDVNFESELENERFRALVFNAEIDAVTAYEVVHLEKIKQNLQREGAQNGEEGKTRPSENARMHTLASSMRTDPASFTKRDLAMIRKQVAEGKTVRSN